MCWASHLISLRARKSHGGGYQVFRFAVHLLHVFRKVMVGVNDKTIIPVEDAETPCGDFHRIHLTALVNQEVVVTGRGLSREGVSNGFIRRFRSQHGTRNDRAGGADACIIWIYGITHLGNAVGIETDIGQQAAVGHRQEGRAILAAWRG